MRTNDLRIELPASKSLSNRWLIVNHCADGAFVLKNLSDADDTRLLAALLQQLRHRSSTSFYCHNAGSAARFLLALLAFTPGQWTLSGDLRLKERPIAPLVDALRQMGCRIDYAERDGCLPLDINGYLPQHKMTTIDPTASSQFVSALLLVGPLLPKGLTLTLNARAASRPYIDMTLSVLRQAGIGASVSPNNRVYRTEPVATKPHAAPQAVTIEKDWSSAAFIFAAAALVPGLRMRMVGLPLSQSAQGDRAAADIFASLGVECGEVRSPYRTDIRSVTVEGTGRHAPVLEYNFIDCPDLMPAVLAACAALGMKARLKGVQNLRLKESNRIAAMQTELEKMGAIIATTATEVRLSPSALHPTQPVQAHGDHRIVMAFAVLSLRYPDLKIEQPDLVSKSFPGFWDQLNAIRRAAQRQQRKSAPPPTTE